MVRRDVSRLPVSEPDEDGQPKLVGWLTHHDLSETYAKRRAKQTLEDSQEYIFSHSQSS